MNTIKKSIIALATLALALTCLQPPWYDTFHTRTWRIFSPIWEPSDGFYIDMSVLFLEWIAIAGVAVTAWIATEIWEKNHETPQTRS